MEKITLKIEGMTTPCCAEEVKEALLKVKGVKKASTCLKRGIAEIEIEADQLTDEQLIKVIEKAGFKAKVKKEYEEGELQVLMKKFEIEFKKLAQKYNIPQKEIEEHWNLVKKEAAEVYQRCCDWSLGHGMAIKDAEAYCQSAILVGIGKLPWAEQVFEALKGSLKKMTDEEIKQAVKDRYDEFAKEGGFICSIMNNLAGYSKEQLSLVPEVARKVSRGCGNPTSFANLKPGEVVVDFGCGGGIDVVLASHKVGPEGTVVGIDFAPGMIEAANQAIKEAGLKNAS